MDAGSYIQLGWRIEFNGVATELATLFREARHLSREDYIAYAVIQVMKERNGQAFTFKEVIDYIGRCMADQLKISWFRGHEDEWCEFIPDAVEKLEDDDPKAALGI